MQNLTLNDNTQIAICNELKETERLLARAASRASGSEQSAEVWAMPDLGLPHNVTRIHGGFFTGALYTWNSSVPIVPVDATVNICSVSVFKIKNEITNQDHFDHMLQAARRRLEVDGTYTWNFHSGNHFITYGTVSGSPAYDGKYLVLHSSSAEFKQQYVGLYPTHNNWYAHGIKEVRNSNTNRYLRYLDGQLAEKFYNTACMLEEFNCIRHQRFAELICGSQNIEEEITNKPHYGMPTNSSVAIGCQWLSFPTLMLLLTAPKRPLYFINPLWGGPNEVNVNRRMLLYPHGLGKRSAVPLTLSRHSKALVVNSKSYKLNQSLVDDKSLELRGVDDMHDKYPAIVSALLRICPGKVEATLQPLFSYDRTTANGC